VVWNLLSEAWYLISYVVSKALTTFFCPILGFVERKGNDFLNWINTEVWRDQMLSLGEKNLAYGIVTVISSS
jgi:hypothetical protein